VQDARAVFDRAAEVGFTLHTLDVGGGFSADTFEPMAAVLSQALDEHFPADVRVIGEPGRYYVATAFTLACHVIARRTIAAPTDGARPAYKLYLNDGVYGNFSNIMFDHQNPVPRVLRAGDRFAYDDPRGKEGKAGKKDAAKGDAKADNKSKEPDAGKADDKGDVKGGGGVAGAPGVVECSVWGPTCDGIDCISQSIRLHEVLDVGDWMYFDEMGGKTLQSPSDDPRSLLNSLHQVLGDQVQRLLRPARRGVRQQRAGPQGGPGIHELA
jgi:ornithine decarboxylase